MTRHEFGEVFPLGGATVGKGSSSNRGSVSCFCVRTASQIQKAVFVGFGLRGSAIVSCRKTGSRIAVTERSGRQDY